MERVQEDGVRLTEEELEELITQMDGHLDPPKARAIYEAGYSTVYMVSKAKPGAILKALQK